LNEFRKIPFACSYLPGKSGAHVKVGIYAMGLLAFAGLAVQIEYFLLDRAVGITIYCAIWASIALWAWLRWRRFARSPYNWLQFDDLPPTDIESLDLHNPPPLRPSEPLPAPEAPVSQRLGSSRPGSILSLASAAEPMPLAPSRSIPERSGIAEQSLC
jgi:hypothetical protein